MVCHTLSLPHDVLVAIDEFVTIRSMPSAVLEKHHDMTWYFPEVRTNEVGMAWGMCGEICL